MLKKEINLRVIEILDILIKDGPKWKDSKDLLHLNKRKKRNHIPLDWTLEDYNKLIVNIARNLENEAYLYFKRAFHQWYIVIGDKYWIIMIGEDGIMETAFPPSDYTNYISEIEGYSYLGTIKEVRNYEL